jgi:hypothetical protein
MRFRSRTSVLTIWAFGVCTLLLASPVRADDLVESVRVGLQQSRETIATLQAEFEMRREPANKPPKSPADLPQRVRWVQSGNVARFAYISDLNNYSQELLWKNGELKVVFSQGPKDDPTRSGTLMPDKRPLQAQPVSPWLHAMFISMQAPHQWFDELIRDSATSVKAAPAKLGGRDTIHVTFQSPDGGLSREIWVEPKSNYLITKAKYYAGAGGRELAAEREATDIREVKPGVYFPHRSEARFYKSGKVYLRMMVTFAKVAINDPVNAAALELKFPEGLSVTDQVQNRHYVVDADEQPVPGSETLVALSKEEQLRLEALRPWYRRWTTWLAVGAGAILLAFAAGAIRWRRRLAR